ncbi:MAG: sulfatase [Planctomycetota bacterium]|nr:sulfatase [Planctomycetota bacterium]
MMPTTVQTRRSFLQSILSTGVAFTAAGCLHQKSRESDSARPPNFIIIFCDDLGYGDLACYGNTQIKTANLDKMASEGLKFTNFYACAALCTPSRVGLMTGRYQIRSGLTRVLFPKDTAGFPDSEISLASALKPLGYSTAIVGKWHLGCRPEHLPTRHGFDYYFGIPYSNDMTPTPLMRNEEVIEEPAHQPSLTTRYTEEATNFIKQNRNKPFFLYLAHNMPHVPLAVSDKLKGKSAGGLYGDVIEEIDWSVGQILATLKKYDLDEKTLVIFTSDNGPWLEKKKGAGSAGPLRNGKGTPFEGGIREPAIARWPGKIAPGRVTNHPAITVDLFPTFIKLGGGSAPTDRRIDGRDITPIFLNTGARPDENFFFYIDKTLRAHRSGPWKVILPAQAATRPTDPQPLLFNLDEDPSEKTNVAAKYPEIMQRLQQQIAVFQKSL